MGAVDALGCAEAQLWLNVLYAVKKFKTENVITDRAIQWLFGFTVFLSTKVACWRPLC